MMRGGALDPPCRCEHEGGGWVKGRASLHGFLRGHLTLRAKHSGSFSRLACQARQGASLMGILDTESLTL
jgi:hypothetical protein